MIEMTDRIRGIWFVTLPGSGDWMGAVEAKGDGPLGFKMQYRFRYYRDNKSFDSLDEKNWYRVEADDKTVRMGLDLGAAMAAALAERGGGEKWEILRGAGTFEDFIKEYKTLPFVTYKQAKRNPDGSYTPL